MVLARVKGTVVSTHKPASMEGLRLLLLEKIDAVTLKGKGDYVVGIDSVGANAGEIVFYVTGSSARMTDTTKGKPSDATIIAIVDAIEKDGELTYDKYADIRGGRDGSPPVNLARVRGTVVATQRGRQGGRGAVAPRGGVRPGGATARESTWWRWTWWARTGGSWCF